MMLWWIVTAIMLFSLGFVTGWGARYLIETEEDEWT
jgi:amino acid permease